MTNKNKTAGLFVFIDFHAIFVEFDHNICYLSYFLWHYFLFFDRCVLSFFYFFLSTLFTTLFFFLFFLLLFFLFSGF